jgi:site-specific recombinase XerC
MIRRRESFSFVGRPTSAVHGHPVLVFDRRDRLHLPLTTFAKVASRRLSPNSMRVYLYAILPFFTFAELHLPGETHNWWIQDPQGVRSAVASYLEEELGCLLRRHRSGFELVTMTGRSRGNVGAFLAAVKLFYSVMREAGAYAAENPLMDIASFGVSDDEHYGAPDDQWPTMPSVSGVETPRSHKRLTDSFFKLVGCEWMPRIIDDPTFPATVLAGGHKLPGWGLREDCITRLLFETGGRIFEVTGLSLADWVNRGVSREATAVSKGSHGRRVKFFRFSSETATLLRRYFDGERRSHDQNNAGLADYLRRAEQSKMDLRHVPLFLSSRGTPFTAKSFRETYWAPACKAADIDADPHQTRHWYVTMAVRTIHETSATEAQIRLRIRELVGYMGWRGGQQTMAAYDHYFDAARHADIQDQLHERLRVALEQGLKRRSTPIASRAVDSAPPRIADPDLAFLRGLGGAHA